MMNDVKITAMGIMVSTGAALVLLAVFAMFNDTGAIYVRTVFEILGANAVICVGLALIGKLEGAFAVLKHLLLEASYVIAVLLVFGLVFDWYFVVPVWYLVVMAVAIYAFVVFAGTAKMRRDVREINELLRKRWEK